MSARKRSQERPVSYWFDFLVFVLIVGALSAAVLLLPGCGERERPVVRPLDCADFGLSPDGCL